MKESGCVEKLYQPKYADLTRTRTFSAKQRHNLVRIDTLLDLAAAQPLISSPELTTLAEKIVTARENGRPVVLFYGAHVIKCGLSRYLIRMIQDGVLTHVASNGAGSIHDFELAYLGGTSEHVPTAIEDGSFGMWEETGSWMNQAIITGNAQGMGYGRALAAAVAADAQRYPHREDCVFYQAYRNGVAATYHVSIGTDIIHQHPEADFAAIGAASGRDFAAFTQSICDLEGGVFLNMGSAVTGPEVFLKALSIARNQGNTVEKITTANFDLLDLGDYRSDIGSDAAQYYYRPRKNVINRPVSMGGTGLYIRGNHQQTLPTLYHLLKERGQLCRG